MTLLPPDDEYDQRVQTAFKQHVANGLMTLPEAKDAGDVSGWTPEQKIGMYRETYAPDWSDEQYGNFLEDNFGEKGKVAQFKLPAKSFGEQASSTVQTVKHALPTMARQAAFIGGAQVIPRIAKQSVWKIGAPVMGGLYISRLAGRIYDAHTLSKIANSIPDPEIQQLRTHYIQSLTPSLTAKGYSPQQIINVAQHHVDNVLRGYTSTYNSLMGNIQEDSQDMMSDAAEGIANIALLGIGGGFFKRALMSGAKRLAGEKAAQAVADVAGTSMGKVSQHLFEGAVIGGGYGLVTGGIEGGAQAVQTRKNVLAGMAKNAIIKSLEVGAGGAVLGGGLHATGAVAGATGDLLGKALSETGTKAVLAAAKDAPLSPEEIPNTAIPPGADLNTQGGLAPETTPPALQGPLGERSPAFAPPGKVPPAPGLETTPPSTAEAAPLGMTGPTPEMQPRPITEAPQAGSPAATLREPIDVEQLPPATPEEIAPRLAKGPPTGTIEGEKPAGTVEPLELSKEPSPLEGLREAGEPHSVSLPTHSVEKFTEAIQKLAPAVEGSEGTARKLEGATVDVAASPDGQSVIIRNLKGAEHGSGASGKALDKMAATADASGTPLSVTVTDYKGPRGGTVPAEKIAKWYEGKGFVRTGNEGPSSVSLARAPKVTDAITPEQAAATAVEVHGPGATPEVTDALAKRVEGLPPEKVAEATGNVQEGQPLIQGKGKLGIADHVGNQLDLFANQAQQRLTKKLGRLSAGVDPTMYSDLAVIGAAKMYRLGMNKFAPWAGEMVKDFGETIREHLQPIFTQAKEFLQDRIERTATTFTKAKALLSTAEQGKAGFDWYNNTKAWTDKHFGADSDMFTRFLCATSGNRGTEANVTLAMKAYAQWKLGLPFDGYPGVQANMLDQAVRGDTFGDRKIQSILGALRGDPNAVVIDTRVMRALGFETGSEGRTALSDRQYDLFEAIVRDLAKQSGQTPREFQAALWTANKIKAAQEATTPRDITKVGSFHPYESIAERKLGGLTPLEWVEKNRVTYDQLANASTGVTKTRAGAGFSYDPYTFRPIEQKNGIVTTLASQKIPTEELTGSAVINFAKRFKKLTDIYYGTNISTFNLGEHEPGMSSVDFNVVLPEEYLEQAKELGRSRKQLALWNLSKEEEIPTGYAGPSADAPKNWDKEMMVLDDIMSKLDLPGRAMKDHPFERQPDMLAPKNALTSSSLEAMTRTPHRWVEYAAQALNVTEPEVKKLVDEGKLTPMSDYNMTNKVEVHKDGTVWEYVDPSAPSYNIMRPVGSFRIPGKVVPLLDYLSGKDILSGNDIVQNYRSQAGFIRPGSIPGATQVLKMIQKQKVGQIEAAMVKNQGQVITNPSVFKYTRPEGMSLWIGPNGKIIQIPFHLRSADRVVQDLKLKNPVQYEGPEHGVTQTILNRGFLRVQMHAQSYAVDATAPLTSEQILALKAIRPGPDGPRDFVARTVAPNGEHRDFYAGTDALKEFIDASEKGAKK